MPVKIINSICVIRAFALSAGAVLTHHRIFLCITSGVVELLEHVKGYIISWDCCSFTPIVTTFDRFNIVAPTTSEAIEAVMGVMAHSSSTLPFSGPGEVFYSSFAVDSLYAYGLSYNKRCKLLIVLLMGIKALI